jgi:hypothetical protein
LIKKNQFITNPGSAKKNIDSRIRNIERERRKIEGEEKKLKVEIKKMAKANQLVNIISFMIFH